MILILNIYTFYYVTIQIITITIENLLKYEIRLFFELGKHRFILSKGKTTQNNSNLPLIKTFSSLKLRPICAFEQVHNDSKDKH